MAPNVLGRSASDFLHQRHWLPHREDAWVPSKLTKQTSDHVTFETDAGEAIVLPVSSLADLDKCYAEHLDGVDDVCSLAHVNKGALLATVRARYARKDIYTRVARTLIAVNPFGDLPIYSTQHLHQYAASVDSLQLPPHIFGIGQDAIRGLRESDCDQAVLISGESGAGKTESAKLIMSFVSKSLDGTESNMMQKMLHTNPILEAFGNAMTVRNNNSSRFGKWQDMSFSAHLTKSLGCHLTSYLLETTRVCGQAKDERNFHVFFQLIGARDSPEFAELQLQPPEHYRYLRDGNFAAPGINDAKCFRQVCESLTAMGFTDVEQMDIFTVLAGVLNLGNCEFETEGEGSRIVDVEALKHTAQLLKIDATMLKELMLVRKICVGSERTRAINRADKARSVRDALARLIYGRLFQWLIQRMNTCMSSETPACDSRSRLLGVLDIAGFECFEHNSLEQLLINLSNEHLQQQFNQHVFKSEVEECRQEGVELVQLTFVDNADLLALIDAKGGILDTLDETCKVSFANTTDATFVNKVVSRQREHPRFISPKIKKSVPSFGVKHFAGDVNYSCEGWLEKNMEKLPPDTHDVLSQSEMQIVRALGGHAAGVTPAHVRTRRRVRIVSNSDSDDFGERMSCSSVHSVCTSSLATGKRPQSMSSGFRASLNRLMVKISDAEPHYIRCVKPNSSKVPWKFEGPLVMEQLLFSGVFAAVQIRQKGFAHRVPHNEFLFLYSCIVDRFGSQEISGIEIFKRSLLTADAKGQAQALVNALPTALSTIADATVDESAFAVGHTKVFVKFAAFRVLDEYRTRALHSYAALIQCVFRGHLARRLAAQKLAAVHQEQCAVALAKEQEAALQASVEAERMRFEDEMVLIRAALEKEFVEKLAAERASVELEFAHRLSIEQAKLEEARSAIVAAEKEIAERSLHERIAAEEKLANEKVALEKDFTAKLLQLESKLDSDRFALEQKSAQEVAAAQTRALAVESALAESKRRLAAQQAEQSAVIELLEVTKMDLENKLQQERFTAKLEFERRLPCERQLAQNELLQRLNAEHDVAQRELARKLVEEHFIAEQQMTQQFALERASLEEVLNQRLALQQARAAAAEQIAMEKSQSEWQLLETLERERNAAEQEFAEKLSMERSVAEQKLAAQQAVAERELAIELLAAEKELSEKLYAKHAATERELTQKLAVERQDVERALELKRLEEHYRVAAESLFAEYLARKTHIAHMSTSEQEQVDPERALDMEEHRHIEQEISDKSAIDHAVLEAERVQRDFENVSTGREAQFKHRAVTSRVTELKKQAREFPLPYPYPYSCEHWNQATMSVTETQYQANESCSTRDSDESNTEEGNEKELDAIHNDGFEEDHDRNERETTKFAGARKECGVGSDGPIAQGFYIGKGLAQRFYIEGGGVIISERSQLLTAMRAATEDYDLIFLETLFSLASATGLGGDERVEPFASARALHKRLTCKENLLRELMELRSAAGTRPEPSFLVLRRLFHLAEFIRQANYPGGIMWARMAEDRLQKALIDVARYRGLRSIFNSDVDDEVDLACKTFGKLRYFQALKDGLDDEHDVLLSHSHERINSSLTRTPEGSYAEEYNNGAILNFFNILVCMGDKPAQDCQRLAARAAVLEMASTSCQWREEVYSQVMKQLARNTSPRSLQLGWELLRDMCDVEPPSAALGEFVRALIRRSEPELIRNCGVESNVVAALRECKSNLNSSLAWRRTSQALCSVFGFVASIV